MATVTHKLELPDGTVPSSASVTITLVASADGSPAEGHGAGFSIAGAIRPVIDGTGTWTANLIANSLITPTGTVYKVVEALPSSPPVTLYILVPPGGDQVQNILVPFPSALPSLLGPQGIQGPTGAPGPAGITTNPRGQWLVGTTYAAGSPPDAAYDLGVWYISLQNANTGHTPTPGGDAWWAPAGLSTTDARVFREKINVMAAPYLMDNTGVDSTAGLTAAIAAIPAAGGELFFPPGLFVVSAQAVFDGLHSVKLSGVGGLSAGATPASMLRFTMSGAAGAISARSTLGFVVEDLAVQATNGSFTGYLIDLSHSALATDSAYAAVNRCALFAPTTCGALLNLDKAISSSFSKSFLNGAAAGVLGRTAAANYSNANSFDACTFAGSLTAGIHNPGDGWTLSNSCTFEGLSGGGAGAVLCDATYLARGLAIIGGWFGDAGIAGDWINFQGSGLTILGGYMGGGNVGVRLPSGIAGAVIQGVEFDQTHSNAVAFTNGGKNCVVTGNNVDTVVGVPVVFAAGNMPSASMIQNDSQGSVWLTADTQIVAGAVSDANFPVPPPNGTRGFDSTNLQAYIRVGGVWRKSAAYT